MLWTEPSKIDQVAQELRTYLLEVPGHFASETPRGEKLPLE
jgi:hypothetical protein